MKKTILHGVDMSHEEVHIQALCSVYIFILVLECLKKCAQQSDVCCAFSICESFLYTFALWFNSFAFWSLISVMWMDFLTWLSSTVRIQDWFPAPGGRIDVPHFLLNSTTVRELGRCVWVCAQCVSYRDLCGLDRIAWLWKMCVNSHMWCVVYISRCSKIPSFFLKSTTRFLAAELSNFLSGLPRSQHDIQRITNECPCQLVSSKTITPYLTFPCDRSWDRHSLWRVLSWGLSLSPHPSHLQQQNSCGT